VQQEIERAFEGIELDLVRIRRRLKIDVFHHT
jgi:hypothetical protein